MLTEEEREAIFGHASVEYGKKIKQLGSAWAPFFKESNLTLPVFRRYHTYLRLCNLCIPFAITELELKNKWGKKRKRLNCYPVKLFFVLACNLTVTELSKSSSIKIKELSFDHKRILASFASIKT